MKLKPFSLIILAIFTLTLNCQNISGGSQQLDFIRESLRINKSSKLVSEADGSPYVNEEFKPVKITGYDDKIFTARYNAYNGQMEVDTGENIIALNSNNEYEVIFTQDNLVYQSKNYVDENGENKNGFLLLLSKEKNITFFKKENIKYYEKTFAKTPYEKDRPAKFKKSSNDYFYKHNNLIKQFPTKKKELLKLYPKNIKKIKTYLKKNRISLKDENDLKKLASFLATL